MNTINPWLRAVSTDCFQPNVRILGTQGARLEGLLEEITRQLDEGKTGADLYLGLSSTDAVRGSACRLVTIFSR
jgi:hypothetical protein